MSPSPLVLKDVYGGAIISEYCISRFGALDIHYFQVEYQVLRTSMASGVKRSDDYESTTWIDCIGNETT